MLPEDVEDLVEEDTTPPPPDKVEESPPEDIVPEEAEDKEPEPEPEEKEPEPEEKEPPRDALDDLLSDNPFRAEERVLVDRAAKLKKTPVQKVENLPDLESTQRARVGAGEGTGAQARVQAIILAQVRVCWPDVVDLPDPERLQVSVKFNLKADGTLKDGVDLVRPRRAPIGDRFMGVAIDRALRAVRKCQPYSLPAEDYAIWQEVTVHIGTIS